MTHQPTDASMNRRTFLATAALAAGGLMTASVLAAPTSAPGKRLGTAQNLILVTMDGFRWQEMFGGYDAALNTKAAGGVANPATVAKRFEAPTPEERRAKLLPFLWGTVAKNGQILGDRASDHVAVVTNPHRFSYPGYSELLCGFVDPAIDSNKSIPNPNVTVLEWLNGRPGFAGRVGVRGAWDVIRAIVNPDRSKLDVSAGWDPIAPPAGADLTPGERVVNELLATTTRYWAEEPPDSLVAVAAVEHLVARKPRVLYASFGETDEWAHGRRYDLYLEAAQQGDAAIRKLWETAQSMPEYAGKTALLVTTDHGRGATGTDWTSHGAKVPGADGWWAAAMGPGVPALGVRRDGAAGQDQAAATIAAMVGEDYVAGQPKAAPALPIFGG